MARLDRAIHAFGRAQCHPRILGVDGRVKHGHDGVGGWVIGHDGWYEIVKSWIPAFAGMTGFVSQSLCAGY
jgi:hypothetical protein